jgi:transcriptional regulator with XRE-family HTH domain
MPPTTVQDRKRQRSARENLAANLVVLRRGRGWSQEDLALEAGLHRTFVAHVERGARNIALDNIEKLAAAFGVETYRLLVPRSVVE